MLYDFSGDGVWLGAVLSFPFEASLESFAGSPQAVDIAMFFHLAWGNDPLQ